MLFKMQCEAYLSVTTGLVNRREVNISRFPTFVNTEKELFPFIVTKLY
jgi:hypothetical protein